MATRVFSYEDYLALILIYTANASDGISMEEQNYILQTVGSEHYEKCIDFFDHSSEVEIVELIDELSEKFARNNREKVLADIEDLIEVDEVDHEVEEQIFRMLKKLI